MEQVFFQFHLRSVNTVTRIAPAPVRSCLEFTVLSTALTLIALLVSLHASHVWPHDGGCLETLVNEHTSGRKLDYQIVEVTIAPPRSGFLELQRGVFDLLDLALPAPTLRGKTLPWKRTWGKGAEAVVETNDPSMWSTLLPPPQGPLTYSFSFDKGWLLLSSATLLRHKAKVKSVTVAADDACMGPHPILRGVLQSWLGYDAVASNWFAALGSGRGWVRLGPAPPECRAEGSHGIGASCHKEPELVDLRRAAEYMHAAAAAKRGEVGLFVAFKLGVGFTTLFLFFVTKTLVAFTLRETQERMLKFTFLLQHHVRHHLSYWTLILTHMVDSLVYLPIMAGTLYFLFEFFAHDQVMAFAVLSGVWIAEVFSAVCVRTAATIRFFPRFFFLYFVIFHVYVFSFPFGFSFLALVSMSALLLHAMMHFWNRFEVRCPHNLNVVLLS